MTPRDLHAYLTGLAMEGVDRVLTVAPDSPLRAQIEREVSERMAQPATVWACERPSTLVRVAVEAAAEDMDDDEITPAAMRRAARRMR